MDYTFEINIKDKVLSYTDRIMEDLGLDESKRDKVDRIVYDDITNRISWALEEIPVERDFECIVENVKNYINK